MIYVYHFISFSWEKLDRKSSYFIAEDSTERLSDVLELLPPVNPGLAFNKGGSIVEDSEHDSGDTTQTGDYFCHLPTLSSVGWLPTCASFPPSLN